MDFVFKRMYRGPVQAIILDWAGTTVDFGCMAPVAVFREVFKRRGIDVTLEQARSSMGMHKREHLASLARQEDVSFRWQELYGRKPTEADVSEMFQDFVPLQLECLTRHAELIPGTLEAVRDFRSRRLKIGTTTGYTQEMMAVLVPEARRRGYEPDNLVCSDQVPSGRPLPWMCLKNAMDLQLYPLEAFVKVGDTPADIAEGLNAGMWTIGCARSGNEMGLTESQLQVMDPEMAMTRCHRARERLHQAGAHYVVDSIADVPDILDDINDQLSRGQKP